MHERRRVTEKELEAYIHRCQTGPCFICQIVAGKPEERHRIVYEDDIAIVFLDRYPKLYGYTLVAPREHREQVTGDFAGRVPCSATNHLPGSASSAARDKR